MSKLEGGFKMREISVDVAVGREDQNSREGGPLVPENRGHVTVADGRNRPGV